ncbi:MAG TPA: DUF6178 family protein [Syntrophales bacterium]|nr:DUF6178 family protein [Syntrophales bacterium]
MNLSLSTSKRKLDKAIPASRETLSLSGGVLLQSILDDPQPKNLVRELSDDDFFWVIKRIGTEDSLPVLALATENQVQYILDLEIWRKDQIDPGKALIWLNRLAEADPQKLSSLLMDDGEDLLRLLLYRTTEVLVVDETADVVPPPGFLSLDGTFFFRTFREEDEENVERLLRFLAADDPERMQETLSSLASLLPAEAEEELYRLRNGRIAEYGFLPQEEAIAVYSPLEPGVLEGKSPPLLPGRIADEDTGSLVPRFPLVHLGEGRSLLSAAFSKINDPLFFDRILVELSGLCNQLIAAEGFPEIDDPSDLETTMRKAAGFLNIALEYICGERAESAVELLWNNPMQTIFRVGYGFAARLHRDANCWRRESWFIRQGFGNDFWGSPREEILNGLLAPRPRFFVNQGAQEPYRDFQTMDDLNQARRVLRQLQELDRIIARLEGDFVNSGVQTYHPLLFNRWARRILGIEVSTTPLSRVDAEQFFRIIRRGDAGPPYHMPGYGEMFVADFLTGAYNLNADAQDALREALSVTWEEFRTEYEHVPADSLDARYSRFLGIT